MHSKILATLAFATSIALAANLATDNDVIAVREVIWHNDPEFAKANNMPLQSRSTITTEYESSLVPRAENEEDKISFKAPRRKPQRPVPKTNTPTGGCTHSVSTRTAISTVTQDVPCNDPQGQIQNLRTPGGGQVKLQCNRGKNGLTFQVQDVSKCDVTISFVTHLVVSPDPPRRGDPGTAVTVLTAGGGASQLCSITGINDSETHPSISVKVSLHGTSNGC